MRKSVVEDIIVWLLYWPFWFLRILFLSSKAGELIHNGLIYSFGKLSAPQIEHERKYEMLKHATEKDGKMPSLWIRRVYLANPNYWKHTMKNIYCRRLCVGSIKRRRLARQGFVVPSRIVISLSNPDSGCNLSCQTCYAGAHSGGEMSLYLLEKILKEQEELGVYMVTLAGGEPFLYSGIWEVVKKFPKTTFFISTNATTLGEREIGWIRALGNIGLLIAIEGFEKETDEIRGKGVFEKVRKTMKACQDQGIVYVINITVTTKNFEVTLSDQFLQFLVDAGCFGISYCSYLPLGKNPKPEWQLSEDQYAELTKRGGEIFKRYPLFITIGRNGSGLVCQCDAARQNIHFLPDGRAEPCVFMQWADQRLNVATHSILEITSSYYFKKVRELTDLKIPGLIPCRFAVREIFEKILPEFGAQPSI